MVSIYESINLVTLMVSYVCSYCVAIILEETDVSRNKSRCMWVAGLGFRGLSFTYYKYYIALEFNEGLTVLA